MNPPRQTELERKREKLLKQLAEIDSELESTRSSDWSDAEKETVRRPSLRQQRPLRSLCLDTLGDCGFMLYSHTISQLCRAQLGREIPSTRFGTLSSDEQKAFENGRPRPVFLCHGLTHDRGEAMKRLWGRSEWPLEDRIVGPMSGRVLFLRSAEWISRLAEEAESGSAPAARPELLMYMAADCARDLGFRVRKGARDFGLWREAAREELDRRIDEDLEQRREAAERLAPALNDMERLFGAREGLTVLPGTVGAWRSAGEGASPAAPRLPGWP